MIKSFLIPRRKKISIMSISLGISAYLPLSGNHPEHKGKKHMKEEG
jgi:hypothetical protein